MYFLNRWGSGPGTCFERMWDLDPARLLAATYNFAIQTPERLTNQLDVCARIAATVGVFEVTCPRR